jgi:hypothetical protein
MRESDFAGRYGGEEFVMLLPAADLEAGLQVAERVRAAIADIQLFEESLSVTASFGVAVFPDHASDGGRLIRSAGRALYQAKAKGRNRVEVFSHGNPLRRLAERPPERAGLAATTTTATIRSPHGRVAELADAQDSGSCVLDGTWGFNSPLAHESTDVVRTALRSSSWRTSLRSRSGTRGLRMSRRRRPTRRAREGSRRRPRHRGRTRSLRP